MGADTRRLRLLIIDAASRSIVTENGGVPWRDIDLLADETTITAAGRVVADRLGLAGPVVDCFIDQVGPTDEDGSTPRAVLVEFAAATTAWDPPNGMVWASVESVATSVTADLETSLVGLAQVRLEEIADGRVPPPLRAAWSMPGWYERAAAWVSAALSESGRGDVESITRVRHWGISAVLQVATAEERFWFKASFPPFHAEPAISRFLDRAAPGLVANVVAINDDEGWLLTEHLTGSTLSTVPDEARGAIDRLVDVQERLAGRERELIEQGVPRRQLCGLPEQVAEMLERPSVRHWIRTDPKRIDRALAWLPQAIDEVEGLGFGDRLVHGDFHPGNVMSGDDGIRLFDWSDAALSNPIVDVVTWATWFRDDPARVDHLWSTFRAVWRERCDVDVARVDQRVLDAVAGAHNVVSYGTLIDGLESHRQIENAEGLTEFLALLEAVA